MSWPLSQDYNEAVQDPRSSFSDAELKTGEAVCNALGIPLPRSGNFADVYEVRCPSGARWAVKCFTREVHGLRERYAEISKYLRKANLPFTVDFHYLEQGIRVRGQWYPVLKMQWVEGFVLNEFVRDNLDKKPILHSLGQIWVRMARRLRDAKLAHCDLQHGNVMFVPGSSANSLAVKLIDYDGMCVPSLAGKNSGELGHPAYQHPERLRTAFYGQEVDRFSLLSIAAALRCLTIGGRALWQRYDNGDNLLFRQADLKAPAESPLFQELLSIGDPQAQRLVTELYRACRGPLSAVPWLNDLAPQEKRAAKVAITAAPAMQEQVPDWDFSDDEPGTPLIRKRRSAGVPLWFWGALGGVAALLLSVGIGAGLFWHNSSDKKEKSSVAPTRLAENSPDSAANPQSKANLDEPPPSQPPPAEQGTGAEDRPAGIFCLTPAGDKLAISDAGSNTWRLIDPHTNQMLRRFTGHTGPITAIAFSADGRRAVTSGDDKMLRLWDVQTGQTIGTRQARRQPVVSLALSPDGAKAAHTNGNVDVDLWDFETAKGHFYHHNRKVASVAFSPDGRYLISGLDQSEKPEDVVLLLWPLAPNVKLLRLSGPSAAVSCIAVSPDGKYIAAGQGGNPAMVSLWEAATGRLVKQFAGTRGPFHQVAFSPDSRFLVAAAVNRYQIWPVEPAPRGGVAARGGGDSTQDRAAAVFTLDKEAVTIVYRKAGRVARIQTVPLPNTTVAGAPPPAATGQAAAWDPPADPDRDCKFQNAGGKLTITVPGTYHDLGAERGRMNAPRLLLDVEGDFTAQVHVRDDFQPTTLSTAAGTIPVVGAGLVLLVDDKTYVRLERFGVYRRQQYEDFGSWELRQNGRVTFMRTSPRLEKKETYLRMQRRGDKMLGSVSEDGRKWIDLPAIDVALPRKIKVGVDAISTSFRSFAPIFDQFMLKKEQGELVPIDWPTIPAAGTVAPKPPQPTEEPDAWSHLDLPSDLKPDAKDPILRIPKGRTIATRQEYSGPLDITMVVRGPLDQDVSFIAPGGAMLTFRYNRNSRQSHSLNIRRPDAVNSDFGTEIAKLPIVLPENKWCTLRWEIRSTGMKVTINKLPPFRDPVRYDLTAKSPVKIRVNKAMIELKSVVVKKLEKAK